MPDPITTDPYHILHVETLDGERRHWPLDTSWIEPLTFQRDLANRCCAKTLYAIRVIPKPRALDSQLARST